MKKITTLILFFVLVNSAILAQNRDLQQESLLITFIPNVQFAPIYVTIADGHFADAGFDINLEYLNEPDVLDLVAANQARFGIVSGEQVILASARGREITYFYAWFQQYPVGLVLPDNSPIQTPAELAGYRVSLPGRFGASYNGLIALLASAGLTEADINIEEIGFAAPEVFCLGLLQAATIYINNEPLQIRNRAQQGDCGNITGVRVMPVADYLDLISNGIITNQRTAQNDPDAVQAFAQAFHQGLQTTIQNPAHAYLQSVTFVDGLFLSNDLQQALQRLAQAQETFLATNPTRDAIARSRLTMYESLAQQFAPDELLQFEVLLASIDLWDSPQLGYSPTENWQNMQDTLITLGELNVELDVNQLFTNDFVEALD